MPTVAYPSRDTVRTEVRELQGYWACDTHSFRVKSRNGSHTNGTI